MPNLEHSHTRELEYSMNNGNYTVMIAGIAKSGMEDYVKRFLKQLMEHSRKDNGCIIYNIHQSIDNPSEFMVYMQWKSKKSNTNLQKKCLKSNRLKHIGICLIRNRQVICRL